MAMGWRSWAKGAAGAGALVSSFAAGAMTGRLMLRHELATAVEPARPAPFASDAALVAANAEMPAEGGLRLAGAAVPEVPARDPPVRMAAVRDPWPDERIEPGKPEAPLDDYAAYEEEPQDAGKTTDL
jgi:hypothetical protein